MSRRSRELIRGPVAGLAIGAGAAVAAVVSHLAAGGSATPSGVAWLVVAAGLGCALLAYIASCCGARWPFANRWIRTGAWGVPVVVVLLAHPWLEVGGGHAGHGGGHGLDTHASAGWAGVVQHAVSPAMLMFTSHVIGLAAALIAMRLAWSVRDAWDRGLPRVAVAPARFAVVPLMGWVSRLTPKALERRTLARAPPCPA